MSDFLVAVDSVHSPCVLIEDLECSKTYWFAVRAFNQMCKGELSDPTTAIFVRNEAAEGIKLTKDDIAHLMASDCQDDTVGVSSISCRLLNGLVAEWLLARWQWLLHVL